MFYIVLEFDPLISVRDFELFNFFSFKVYITVVFEVFTAETMKRTILWNVLLISLL